MLNIVIPLAGQGIRFQEAGYKTPKPFIDMLGQTMIERVIKSLKLDGQYIFIAQREHLEKYNGYDILNKIAPKCIIIPLDEQTDGAARTCLKAREYINNNHPLVIANSDQIIDYNVVNFMINTNYSDGCILTFPVENDPKWSYVDYTKNKVTKVVEKQAISNKGNVGLYSWCRGADFVWSAEKMMEDNSKRVNNEWYIAPTYNELISNGDLITWQDTIKFFPCGTPNDLLNTIQKL